MQEPSFYAFAGDIVTPRGGLAVRRATNAAAINAAAINAAATGAAATGAAAIGAAATSAAATSAAAIGKLVIGWGISTLACLLFVAASVADGQEAQPIPNAEPILRVDTGGPSSFVTSMAFSPDGRTLFAGGWDKVVRVWSIAETGEFTASPGAAFRVPVGPGQHGRINTIAISPDGKWLAAAGTGNVAQKGVADFRSPGWILPSGAARTAEMWRDEGTVYLFNLHTRAARQLRHHQGRIEGLAFSTGAEGPLVLASAAQEWNAAANAFQGAVCLWNVGDGTRVAEKIALPTVGKRRPQLTVARTANDLDAVRVAIAWGDGKLRVWDVKQGLPIDEQSDGGENTTVAQLDASTLLTGSTIAGPKGRLRVWSQRADWKPRPDATRQAAFGRLFIPHALALVASVPGQAWDHAAVAVLELQALNGRAVPKSWHLRIVSLKPRSFGETVATTGLWGGSKLPTLATVNGGAYLAVGGSPNHEIRVYPIRELLQKKFGHQKLTSLAVPIRGVAFATRGQEQGLLLRKQDATAIGDRLLFPLGSGELQVLPADSGWQTTQPDADWAIKQKNNQIEIYRNKTRYHSEVQLGPPPSQQVTAFAIAPPPSHSNVPIVAIASHEKGHPSLGLYNGQTGDRIREYTGHTDTITEVAFSPDFRLLASASSDQTVRVWSLTDLGEILRNHGLLAGVTLNEELKTVRVEENAPASETLQVGDRLTGYFTGQEFHEWKSARAFYATWWSHKPGTRLKVRRQRGNRTEDIDLPVGQGIDERKPLFSLLVTRGARPADREQWIGWNPLGPFESSDRRIERYLGWHFNTGDPARPTAFAELDQYRDKYFRRGLLRDLARDGALRPAPAPAPLDRPAMSLSLEYLALQDSAGAPLTTERGMVVPQPAAAVELAVDYAFPDDAIEHVALHVDGKSQGEFRLTEGVWRAELPRAMWQRGNHRIESILKTRESSPQEFTQELEFRFVPSAPRIASGHPSSWRTSEERAALRIEVRAGSTNAPFDVELNRVAGGRTTYSRSWKSEDGAVKINGNVPIELGDNVFEVVAYNRDSLVDATRDQETRRERFVITRFLGDAAPPSIELRTLLAGRRKITLGLGRPAVVTTRRVQVQGLITSSVGNLAVAEKTIGNSQARQPLKGFVAKQDKQFAVNDPVELSPGVQTLTYLAQGESGKSAAVDLAIEYRPPLPAIEIISPFSGQTFAGFMDSPSVQVVASLTLPPLAERHPWKAYVNGDLIDERRAFDAAGRLEMSVPMEFGDHDIEVRLENAWGTTATARTRFSYRPTPKIERVDVPETVDKPFLDLTILGWTETEIDRVVVDGHELPGGAYQSQYRGKVFKVSINEQSFETRQASLTLQLYAKGSPTPAVRNIAIPRWTAQRPTPATVKITDPQRNATITDPSYTIRFNVTSPTPLRAVELRRDRELVYSARDVGELKAVGGELEMEVPVSLKPGTNYFEVTVENDGGIQKESVTLNRMDGPVSLVVKGFTESKRSSELVAPATDSFGTLRFSGQAATDRIYLKGEVRWNQIDSRIDQEDLALQLWVNGYQQPPGWLEERDAGSSTRSFSIPVILSRPRGNLVEIRLPELPREATSRLLLDIDCKTPQEKTELHLLVVGVGATDNDALVKKALEALEGGPPKDETFTTPAFSFGLIHTPLTGPEVNRDNLISVLNELQKRVRQLMQDEDRAATNAVVMVYYQGGELLFDDGQTFLTTRRAKGPARQDVSGAKVNLAMFSGFFEECCGAPLLLLDVNGRVPQLAASDETWPTTSHAAMLRYAWLNDEKGGTLIDALDDIDPDSGRLDEVANQLDRHSQSSIAIKFESFVPRMLENLELKRSPRP